MSKTSFATRAGEVGKKIVMALKHVFFHNGWVKLIALLISLVLWAGLISQDESLTRDKTWQNVSVSVTGEETMKRNGYIVVDGLGDALSSVSVTAAVPQKQYDAAEASAYNLRVDLSKVSGIGSQDLKILSTANATYGKVTSTTPSSVTVEVDEYMVRQRIPISVTIGGEYQNGWYYQWYLSNPTVDPKLIAVSGPRSLAQSISIARVFIDPEDLEWAEGTLLTTGEIKLYNRAGEEVNSPLLGITSEGTTIDTVLIEGTVMPTKAFYINELIELQGEPAKGYKVVSTKVSPEIITVAARNEVLEQMNELALERMVNIQDLSESIVFQIKVQKPSEDAVLSNDTVTVTIDIAPDTDAAGGGA